MTQRQRTPPAGFLVGNGFLLALLLISPGWAAARGGPKAPPRDPGPELNAKTMLAFLDYVRPRPEELRWQAVPWRAAFWDAVVEAADTDKPVLLWTMNGNPLGCT